ncbi:hypothetical protein [Kingella oralis]|uniref:hypothetical protein n=1 Tax=Kingella oralis TaxID=505 RepID=UPI0034E3A5DB
MERWRLADIFSISKTALNQLFGNEPSPLHFKFQAATGVLQRSQPENLQHANHPIAAPQSIRPAH